MVHKLFQQRVRWLRDQKFDKKSLVELRSLMEKAPQGERSMFFGTNENYKVREDALDKLVETTRDLGVER